MATVNDLGLVARLATMRFLFSPGALARKAAMLPFDLLNPGGRSTAPLGCTALTTRSCNLRCQTCFQKETRLAEPPALPPERFVQLLGDIWHGDLMLSGGEPFASPSALPLIEAAARRGSRVGVNTNGTLLEPPDLDRIAAAPMSYVAFTVNGPEPVHDRIAGVPGTFARVTGAARYLRAVAPKLPIFLVCTISRESHATLDEVVDLALADRLSGVVFHHVAFLDPPASEAHRREWTADLGPGPTSAMVYETDLSDVAPAIVASVRRLQRRRIPAGFRVVITPGLSGRRLDDWYGRPFDLAHRTCLYPYVFARVTPSGELQACEGISASMGRVDGPGGLEAAWNGPEMRRFRLRIRRGLMPTCTRCCAIL